MNKNSQKVIIASLIGIMITIIAMPPGKDLTFVDIQYKKYLTEFIEELEDEGIDIPVQKRWTMSSDIRLFPTNILGWAEGMGDNRQVLIKFHPLIKFKTENEIRFIIWHELAHDVYNLEHGTILLMKPFSSPYDGTLFHSAKKEFIQYLKNKDQLKKRKR